MNTSTRKEISLIGTVLVKQPYMIWVKKSYKSINNDDITTVEANNMKQHPYFMEYIVQGLTHCGLVMTYGDIELGQHWHYFR